MNKNEMLDKLGERLKEEDKDKLIGEVIDDLSNDSVKLAEFKAGFIDHVYLMEKVFYKFLIRIDKIIKEFKEDDKQKRI